MATVTCMLESGRIFRIEAVQAINETKSSSQTLCVVESRHVVQHAMKTRLQELVCFIAVAA
ncbi:hypothetical protein CH63R_03942 [Colletotrichum higginsianum IMI 349063]|uniref:Uncharacterized protein n=1 Tax=Colletotrichum higginsianum (strain IMI 349063) TaxID=759273 RepID=A0A1B7YHV9_COLHI|nr:hypothetical protein CH63R_03942 [Colletotrichum higginsianum IMI 349063]OBR11646.1 hypothetical protein CH63R_03942 [Colletotrichum higginsianum IMI 349063]